VISVFTTAQSFGVLKCAMACIQCDQIGRPDAIWIFWQSFLESRITSN